MTPALTELALFDITGPDSANFLQGQLTQDVLTWQPQEIKRAAWCNPKGRMLVTFYVWQKEALEGADSDASAGFRCIIARDLAAKILPRLRMFVLRAKVNISEPLDIDLFAAASAAPALTHAQAVFTLLSTGFAVTTDENLASDTHATHAADAHLPRHWTHAHTAAGVAWISAGNSEQFVPQTTNFELVGGVNFRKGCYPGQEIVARSQYLGKLKQRGAIVAASQPINALQDIFHAGIENPVGRVIQTSIVNEQVLALIEAPHALIEAGASLRVGSAHGAALTLLALPYAVTDITA